MGLRLGFSFSCFLGRVFYHEEHEDKNMKNMKEKIKKKIIIIKEEFLCLLLSLLKNLWLRLLRMK